MCTLCHASFSCTKYSLHLAPGRVICVSSSCGDLSRCHQIGTHVLSRLFLPLVNSASLFFITRSAISFLDHYHVFCDVELAIESSSGGLSGQLSQLSSSDDSCSTSPSASGDLLYFSSISTGCTPASLTSFTSSSAVFHTIGVIVFLFDPTLSPCWRLERSRLTS